LLSKLKSAHTAEEVESATNEADVYLRKRDSERTKLNLNKLDEEEQDFLDNRLDQMSTGRNFM
jgi:hypothetical protein